MTQIEGTFELNTPQILLGYQRPSIQSSADGTTSIELEARSAVHLTLFVTLEPAIATNPVSTKQLECTELAAVMVCLLNVYGNET